MCDIELIAKAPYVKGYPTHPTSYSDYMRQKRLVNGLTQTDISILFNVYTSTIDKWERGVTEPNHFNKKQIIKFLGKDPLSKQQINLKK